MFLSRMLYVEQNTIVLSVVVYLYHVWASKSAGTLPTVLA
jgi:hypothetical protein